MTASLHVIRDAPRTPKAREERLQQKITEAFGALDALIGKHADAPALRTLCEAYMAAEIGMRLYWEGRAERAERALRELLATDLTDDQRAFVLRATTRGRGRRRPVSDHEWRLLEWYRSMDDDSRKVVRVLFERLASPMPNDGDSETVPNTTGKES